MAAGSNVIVEISGVTSSVVDTVCSILTSGRQEDGYVIIMDSAYNEVTRSEYFRVYGNSSTGKSVNISSLTAIIILLINLIIKPTRRSIQQ